MGFSQSIESTVVKDHPADDIHRAGLLKSPRHIALHHRKGPGVLRAEFRKISNDEKQHSQ